MQIVIDIPEALYDEIVNNTRLKTYLELAIQDGTLLSKGHGDLIDRSGLITTTDIRADGSEITYVPYSEIEDAPTILEVDKEE